MKTFRFKTSVKCAGCTARLDDVFANNTGLRAWKFNLGNQDYNLEVDSITASAEDIIKVVSDAGYKCELTVNN